MTYDEMCNGPELRAQDAEIEHLRARIAELEAALQMWTEAHDFMNRKAAEALARVAAMEPK